MATTKDEWKKVLKATLSVTESKDVVVIGGVAVFLYTDAYNNKQVPAEFTHDVDVSISLPALGELSRDHKITVNNKLKKRELRIDKVEVDIYVDHQSNLRFSYEELALWTNDIAVGDEFVRVASLPHLLLLKLTALSDRNSVKDGRDIAKLMVITNDYDLDDEEFDLLVGLTTKDDALLMTRVVKSQAFMDIANRNAKTASTLRKKAEELLDEVLEAQKEPS